MQNLEEQIKLLVEAQGLDSHILRLERELDSIPQQLKEMDEAFKAKSASLKSIEDGLKALLLKRKEKEGELESKEGMIKKYQAQLYQVKTNKEYTALQEEINRVKADNSIIEEDIIKIFDQIDEENRKIAGEKELLKGEEGKLAEEKKRLDADAGVIREELSKLQAQRKDLVAKIDKNILSKYERILRSKDGLAVVPIAGDSCQGCFRILPPQVINEVRMKTELVVCENCTRILYVEE
jgi:predicted  nucleic acid-binding Zn-ribbon protein